jgi:hypothetical protein
MTVIYYSVLYTTAFLTWDAFYAYMASRTRSAEKAWHQNQYAYLHFRFALVTTALIVA